MSSTLFDSLNAHPVVGSLIAAMGLQDNPVGFGLVIMGSIAVPYVLNRILFGFKEKARKPLPSFEAKKMTELLEGHSLEFRAKAKKFLSKDDSFVMQPDEYDTPMLDQRHMAVKRVKQFIKCGLVSVHNIIEDPLRFIAAHELLAQLDFSAIYQFSVHYNLFGGSVLKLGTEKHHKKYLKDIDSMDLAGCFALTEFRHGVNSGLFMDTTAIYDPKKEEFEINTPNAGAQKNWISFAALQARVAVVFAKLEINGKDEGVHAFFVDVKDKKGKLCKGVRIEDVGHKPCLNGNDNGRLYFDHVRIPRDNLLDRYSQVSKDGTYSSSIPKPRDRFYKVADQLMSGRMCIGAGGVMVSKISAAAALNYSCNRMQVRWDKKEMSIYAHLSQRRTLLPILAGSYAMSFGINYVKHKYADMVLKELDRNYTLRLVCAFKSYSTLQGVVDSGVAREKCGGQGLISVNRMADINNVAASLVVVEGDSMLLAQKVAKELLDGARRKGLFDYLVLGKTRTFGYNTSIRMSLDVTSPSFIGTLFAARQHILTQQLGMAMRATMAEGKSMIDAWCYHNMNIALHLSRAFTERLSFIKTREAIAACKDSGIKSNLEIMCEMFALSKIEEDLGWFMTHTSVSPSQGAAITEEISAICRRISEKDALALVDGLGFVPELISMPIMKGDMWKDVME